MQRRETQLLGEIFRRMTRHYGPLHWWPGETPFEVMVGAILTQNTAWGNVEKAIQNLKQGRLFDPKKLLSLPPKNLARFIKPAGYFNVKTKRLRNFLKFLLKETGGDIAKLRRRRLASLRGKLLKVNGVGPETADSILLYALNKPIFVIDAYTKRILARHYLGPKNGDYESWQKFFMERLKKNRAYFNEYHAQLVNIGKDFCRKQPRCHQCPLNGLNWKSPGNL